MLSFYIRLSTNYNRRWAIETRAVECSNNERDLSKKEAMSPYLHRPRTIQGLSSSVSHLSPLEEEAEEEEERG